MDTSIEVVQTKILEHKTMFPAIKVHIGRSHEGPALGGYLNYNKEP